MEKAAEMAFVQKTCTYKVDEIDGMLFLGAEGPFD
jgi:hypothetical protein